MGMGEAPPMKLEVIRYNCRSSYYPVSWNRGELSPESNHEQPLGLKCNRMQYNKSLQPKKALHFLLLLSFQICALVHNTPTRWRGWLTVNPIQPLRDLETIINDI